MSEFDIGRGVTDTSGERGRCVWRSIDRNRTSSPPTGSLPAPPLCSIPSTPTMSINFFGAKKTGTGAAATKTTSAPRVVVTKTTVSVAAPVVRHRLHPPPSTSSHEQASSHPKRKLQSTFSSSSSHSKPRPSDSPPKPKARKLAPEKKRSQGPTIHRVLAQEDSSSSDSSSDDDAKPKGGSAPARGTVKTSYNMGKMKSEKSSRAGTPSAGVGETVVERDVRAHTGASWKGLIHSEDMVNKDRNAYRICR